ncbi:MDR family MFS transporter [Tengunoibacter tsumagoiensis]|uniref:MFS transporter n=1 Tax=Tengunoibacter tsumagoiensis TaxID=2014871 RepID=A0A402A174_9CHLR|nr:MDR family MFS transporter [Tengunoibacter tsumagoiensis]GCE12825.1 MFS transporter [Tengunoibacter tsumagoiensis]
MAENPTLPVESQQEHDSGYKWRVLASVVVGLFMVILDSTVVNVALKSLQQHYSVSTNEAQWVISLYTLALGIATPLSGFLGDRFGVKKVYLTGLALFAFGSLLCGISTYLTSLPFLITARAIQGIGGGIALPLGTALLFRSFPARERGAAFGIFGIVLVFAPAIGPLLGGWLVDQNQIPWIFFLNLPIGAAGLFIGGRFLSEAAGSPRVRTDIPGILLSAIGFGSILFAASVAGEQGAGWTDQRVIIGFIVGIIALLIFAIVELRTSEPLLDLRLYAIPTFAIASVASMVGTIALFGAEFLLPLYLQILRGYTAFGAGLVLLPLAIASAFSSFLGGRLADKIGPRLPIVAGFLLISYNTYQLSQIELNTDINFIIFLLILRGLAVGLIIQNSQVAALLDVPLNRLNRATPLIQATRQTMQSIGVAVLATILTSAITLTIPASANQGGDLSKLPPPIREGILHQIQLFQSQYITGLQHAYQATFVIALVATLLSLFLPGWPGKYNSGKNKTVEAPGEKPPVEVA